MKELFYQNISKSEITNNDRLVEKINQLKTEGCDILTTISDERVLVVNSNNKKETNPVYYDFNTRFCAITNPLASSTADVGISSVCMNSSMNKEMTNVIEKQLEEKALRTFYEFVKQNNN